MSKVYGYCRTALAEGNDMEVQCAIVENYCKDRGMKLEKCFCDDGVSGHNMNREGLDGLFDVLKEGDMVVIKDMSRLSIDPQKGMTLADRICGMGAEIIYAEGSDEDDDVPALKDWIKSQLGLN